MCSYCTEKENKTHSGPNALKKRFQGLNVSQKLLVDTHCEIKIDTHNFGLWPMRQTSPDDQMLFETLQKMKKLKHRSSDAGNLGGRQNHTANRISAQFGDNQPWNQDGNTPVLKSSQSFVLPPSRNVVGDR